MSKKLTEFNKNYHKTMYARTEKARKEEIKDLVMYRDFDDPLRLEFDNLVANGKVKDTPENYIDWLYDYKNDVLEHLDLFPRNLEITFTIRRNYFGTYEESKELIEDEIEDIKKAMCDFAITDIETEISVYRAKRGTYSQYFIDKKEEE